MKIIAILQARVSSTRLPGKVLKHILEQPMLAHQLNRLAHCKTLDHIMVATSTEASDDAIAALCSELNINCFRGNLTDVLDRYYQASQTVNAEHIVRLTGDCPLIDPKIIDTVITDHLIKKADYSNNCTLDCLPDGLDVEIMTQKALTQSWLYAIKPSEREHVTQYIRNNPEKFIINNVPFDAQYSHLRWTVDEPEDFEFVTKVYEHLYPQSPNFNFNSIIKLLETYPELTTINHKFVRNEGLAKSLIADKELGYE